MDARHVSKRVLLSAAAAVLAAAGGAAGAATMRTIDATWPAPAGEEYIYWFYMPSS